MVKIIEKLKFHNRIIFLNRRSTIVMFLGLGISLALLTQSLMFIYSFQYGAFLGFYKEVPLRQMTISIDSFDITGEMGASIPELDSIIEKTIESVGIGDKVKKIDWLLARGLFTVLPLKNGESAILNEFNLYAIPSDYFSALQEILYVGSLINNISDVIAVVSSSTLEGSNISQLGYIPCYTPIFGYTQEQVIATGFPTAGGFLNVSGVISKYNFSNVDGPLSSDFKSLSNYFSEQFMLTSYTNFQSFVTNISYISGYSQPTGRISFHLEKINSFNIAGEISIINQFSQELTRDFSAQGFNTHVYPVITSLLEEFRREFIIFQLFGVLFTIPIAGMALSLTNYSANLLKRKQKRQISSMLQRGCSRKEIMINLILQVVETTISAIIIAFVLGYLFTWLFSKSSGFLLFTGNTITPSVNLIILYIVLISGFVLAILVNAINIWQMSQITTQEAYIEHQEKKPFWEILYFDFILFLIGLILWFIVRFELKGSSAYNFAYSVGTIAPILAILGGVLIVARFYPRVVEKISTISWRSSKLEFLSLAMKRSSRRRADTTRSLILISLTFTLIFSAIVTVKSYQDFDNENAYYQLGSDILINNVNTFNNTTKNQVLAIEGVSSATYIRYTSQILTYGQLTYSYIVIGIDPIEFPQTAYFEMPFFFGSKIIAPCGNMNAPTIAIIVTHLSSI